MCGEKKKKFCPEVEEKEKCEKIRPQDVTFRKL